MAPLVIVCTDGSPLAIHAATRGCALLPPPERVLVVTAIDEIDPTLLYGASGLAGPTGTPEQIEAQLDAARAEATDHIQATVAALPDVPTEGRILETSPGPAICQLAEECDADVIVIGSRGRGGLKRALLGSVSDHVVRHAPCPVLVVNAHDEAVHEGDG